MIIDYVTIGHMITGHVIIHIITGHLIIHMIIGQVPVYSNLAEGEAVFTATVENIDFTWIFLEVGYQPYSDV